MTYTPSSIKPSDVYGPDGWTKETLDYVLVRSGLRVVGFRPPMNELAIYLIPANRLAENKPEEICGKFISVHPRFIVERIEFGSDKIWE